MCKPRLPRPALATLVAAAVALSSCSDGAARSSAEACEPTKTQAARTLGAEARASSSDQHDVWALFFNHWPMPAGAAVRIPVDEEVKIVWRSNGEGSFTIDAHGPDGVVVDPTWGPDPHGSSNWERPGEEWGTGWILPSTGCWTFEISRGETTAHLVAEVFASTAASSEAAGRARRRPTASIARPGTAQAAHSTIPHSAQLL